MYAVPKPNPLPPRKDALDPCWCTCPSWELAYKPHQLAVCAWPGLRTRTILTPTSFLWLPVGSVLTHHPFPGLKSLAPESCRFSPYPHLEPPQTLRCVLSPATLPGE